MVAKDRMRISTLVALLVLLVPLAAQSRVPLAEQPAVRHKLELRLKRFEVTPTSDAAPYQIFDPMANKSCDYRAGSLPGDDGTELIFADRAGDIWRHYIVAVVADAWEIGVETPADWRAYLESEFCPGGVCDRDDFYCSHWYLYAPAKYAHYRSSAIP